MDLDGTNSIVRLFRKQNCLYAAGKCASGRSRTQSDIGKCKREVTTEAASEVNNTRATHSPRGAVAKKQAQVRVGSAASAGSKQRKSYSHTHCGSSREERSASQSRFSCERGRSFQLIGGRRTLLTSHLQHQQQTDNNTARSQCSRSHSSLPTRSNPPSSRQPTVPAQNLLPQQPAKTNNKPTANAKDAMKSAKSTTSKAPSRYLPQTKMQSNSAKMQCACSAQHGFDLLESQRLSKL